MQIVDIACGTKLTKFKILPEEMFRHNLHDQISTEKTVKFTDYDYIYIYQFSLVHL